MIGSNHTIGEPVDLAALYAAGAMSPEELADFERHLAKGCDLCAKEVNALNIVVSELHAGMGCAGIDEVSPPSTIRRTLLARIDDSAQGSASSVSALTTVSAHSDQASGQGSGQGAGQGAGHRDGQTEQGLSGASKKTDRPNPQVWKQWMPDDPNEDISINLESENRWESTGVDGIEIRRLFVDKDRNQMTALVRMAAGTAYPRHIHDTAEECLVLEGDLRAGDYHFREGDYHRMAAGSKHGVQSTENGCLLLIISSLTDELID